MVMTALLGRIDSALWVRCYRGVFFVVAVWPGHSWVNRCLSWASFRHSHKQVHPPSQPVLTIHWLSLRRNPAQLLRPASTAVFNRTCALRLSV
jgi:hypothetical protein